MAYTDEEMEEIFEDRLAKERKAAAKKGKKPKIMKAEEININPAEFIFVLLLAIGVDSIDALDLTGFGVIIARFVDLPALGLLWLWRITKHIGSPRRVKKNPTFKLLLFFLGELSPAGILPFWTAYVIYTYLGEKKSVRVVKTIEARKAKKALKKARTRALSGA